MTGALPFDGGGDHESDTWPLPAAAETFAGAARGAAGVAPASLEGAPSPAELSAVTSK